MNVYVLIVRYILKMNFILYLFALCTTVHCLREKYLQQAMYTNHCIEMLYSLFCSKSTTVIRNLAFYLYQAFKIRKDFLSNVSVLIPVQNV